MKLFFRRTIFIVLFIMIAAGGWLAYERWIKKEPFPDGIASGNGRIEATEIDIAIKFPGRISEILFREGDFLEAGLEILWDSVLIMVLLGNTVFGLGMWRFRRQFE